MKTSLSLTCTILLLWGHAVYCSMNLDNYKVTWTQDFTKMKELSVSPWGPITAGGPTWIAHTPYAGDWINFQNPSGPWEPFNIGNGYLTIRIQKETDGKYYGGLLSSVDSKGNGFSQKYGYFEMSAKLPSGLGSWPAFWLSDVLTLTNKSLPGHEIDVLEAYGDGPGILRSTIHFWDNADPSKNWGLGVASQQCDMYSGFHKYGMDIQPDLITVYYDREMINQFPNKIPGQAENYDRPMYIMIDLAIGGGGSANNETNLDKGPLDMFVEYVQVWQGSGGSNNANSTAGASSLSWYTDHFTLNAGNGIAINGATLFMAKNGDFQVLDPKNNILWHSNTPNTACGGVNCYVHFQNDGNLLLFAGSNPYWGSNTWGNNQGSMTFQNTPPYLQIREEHCSVMWSSEASP